ncbi:MAG TPA: DUF1761 domain-containing protein [Anaerolineales bacterium]|nr:DUF1761 domain-containing protein [Anaerolineales bacterium]HLO28325.1 DUF1761 domain-containing protein [Anaerolineales bacterium]
MNLSAINWLAVFLCTLVYLIAGALWFGGGKKAFFPAWRKAMVKSESFAPGGELSPAVLWPLTVIAAILQAVFMALMVNAIGSLMSGGPTLSLGALLGFMFWLGFVAPASLTNKLFAGHLKAWALETGNHLLDYVLMGAILGAWR